MPKTEKQKAWEKANPEKVREQQARYVSAHRPAILATKRRWRDNNKERVGAATTAWQKAHPEKVQEYARRQSEKRRLARLEKNIAAIGGDTVIDE